MPILSKLVCKRDNDTMKLFIGLMSGTSMDGIDAALVDVESNRFIDGITRPYSGYVQTLLRNVMNGQLHSLMSISQLNTLIGKEFALAVDDLLFRNESLKRDIIAIGSHGQTICHDSFAKIPYTVQLGCAHEIAEHTGFTTVADFRTRDMVVGGQGAPFAPIYHQALFKDMQLPLALINIGGIANITYLGDDNIVKGHDIGPGNCLMDEWIDRHLGKRFDDNGEWAESGHVIPALLEQMLSDSYFQRQLPKSIGKEYFSMDWLARFLHDDYAINDIQATLLKLTGITIVSAVRQLTQSPKQVLICGGGVHNRQLIKIIEQELGDLPVKSTTELAVNADYLEAMMIAWLAEKTINNVALDMSAITGAQRKTVLGVIYPAGIDKRNSHAV